MNFRFINTPEKRKIVAELKEQFGIEELPYLLVESGKDKIRAFSGSLSREEISQISRVVTVEAIGVYLLKKEFDWRISLDGLHLLNKQITKNVVEIDNVQLAQWLRGADLDIKTGTKDTAVIKHKEDLVGCGKSNGEKIFNYVPKERRLKNQNNVS